MKATRARGEMLNRDSVIGRALDIADVEGLDAVTIRRLGQEFGVTPMALYWHVRNKDELLDAMGDQLFVGASVDLDPAASWQDQLRGIVTTLVDALRRHPAAVPLAFPRVLQCDDGRAIAETALRILREAGFSVRQAADIATHAMRTAIMLVVDEPGRAFGKDDAERDATVARKRAALAALPADVYPRITEAADALLNCDDADAYYDFGVNMYVAGVAAQRPPAAQTPPGAHTPPAAHTPPPASAPRRATTRPAATARTRAPAQSRA